KERVGCRVIIIDEGKEPEEFFNLLGGKEPYPLAKISKRIEPRLYLCNVGTGVFVVEEVLHFAQDDLAQEDVLSMQLIIFLFG
ncbi:hypothetical protein CYY_010525, partial [Polysphondylium violaceum]